MDIRHMLGALPAPYDGRDLVVAPLIDGLKKKDVPFVSYTMSTVKNQGQEGSCTAHGGCAVKEYQEMQEHNLTPDSIDLSERFLYDEAKKLYWGEAEADKHQGADGRSIAKVLAKQGVCRESFWKYVPNEKGTPQQGYREDAKRYLITTDYVRITSETQLAPTLYKYGPITFSVMVYDNWLKVGADGIIPDRPWWYYKQPLGGHLIAICGWSPTKKQYKIKNSWGTKWGKEGYCYMSDKEAGKTLMDAFAFVDIPDGKKLRLGDA